MTGIAGALLVCVVWLIFLRRLDVFEPELWKYTLLATFLGGVSTMILMPLLILIQNILFIDFNTFSSTFIYQLLFVAVPEELTKFIPLVIMVRITRQVNEPYDYMKYGMCSALGFATLENVLYYAKFGSYIIDSRAYLSVLAHLCFTSCLVYGYIRQHLLQKGTLVVNFIRYALLGVALHAMYNTLITNIHKSTFYTLGFIFIVYLLVILLRRFINLTLNLSPYFDKEKTAKLSIAFYHLGAGFVLIFLFTAIAIYIDHGYDDFYRFFTENIWISGTLIILITRAFSKIKLIEGDRLRPF